mmetsp:Transcript_28366/g.60079  ORF Transcript_28366/g.60079 Transcript_28366/m.60079 type:complete len:195 (-) Transcript_28366:370-954(-)|eukprot:CAMPEP_0172564180 /NCGR_PEP_ID=MMETSP1067-20121228/103435_1 /TAXON_ID=265564 ORGANISM="Thalassiosira punctigera, Strain Tpunct2005C2" /NCGR_SAMPLE_ID=MMETSP1067 /ASSEMBLY_ACC=CAM_ASM_000444 /LENGTH=194 /DNA_ID=CAMNT_0013354789 /DNA_START=92 /DNA_END=676 /DNA_ORIENTATION=-
MTIVRSRVSNALVVAAIASVLLLHQIDRISCFSMRPPTTLQQIKRHNINTQQQQQHGTLFDLRSTTRPSRSATQNSNSNDVDSHDEKKEALRKTILGLLFPFTVAISANAPFLYVILNPPTPDEREVMLMDFCKGDTCTLLGGGSGYGGGDLGGEVIGAEALAAMPTLEEFEEMARTAAEIANPMVDSVGGIIN